MDILLNRHAAWRVEEPALKHVFGPVPSRRLGRSLGVDPVPLKTCDLNCVYCQLGRTRRPTTRRGAFFSAGEIFAEVATALARYEPGSIDWITFVGSGETTLYSRLGSLLRRVKSLTHVPVAVITNGSLLSRARVREELMAADAVLPSLDAGSEALYRRINRPHHSLTLAEHVDGMIEFRMAFSGGFWLEVMLLAGLNDSEAALFDLASIIEKIGPDEIHLSTPTRPPADPWVEVPTGESMERAASILGRVAKVLPPMDVDTVTTIDGDLVDAVMSVIARHPLKEREVEGLLSRWLRGRVEEILKALPESGKIQVVERNGERFWCAAGMVFPDPTPERRSSGRPENQRREGGDHGRPGRQAAWTGTGQVLR